MNRATMAVLAATATSLVASAAYAQSDGGFALDSLQPTPAGDVFWGVPSPFASGHIAPRGYVAFDYDHRPIRIVLHDASGAALPSDLSLVGAQGILHGDFSMAFFDRLLVSLHMPLAVLNSGNDPATPGVAYTTLAAPRAGDLRIGARGRLFGDEAGPFQLGLEGYLLAPTGDREQYIGEGKTRGIFDVSLGGRVGGKDVAFVYTASGGVELRASDRSHAGRYGVGIGLLALDDILQLDAEFLGVSDFRPSEGIPLSSDPLTVTDGGTNLELLFGAKVRALRGLTFGAAAGPGIGNTVGTPVFRVLGMVGWAPLAEAEEKPVVVAAIKDTDDDGIPDPEDACPAVKGQPNTDPALDGCPPADRDADGILDVDDACPSTAGERSSDVTKNGCPADNDNDGVADTKDACPTVAGEPSDDAAKNGCPADTDGDTIVDRSDACPKQAGPENANPKWNGCPEDGDGDGILLAQDACPNERGDVDSDPTLNGCPKVKVGDGEIVMRQQVQFVSDGRSLQETAVASESDKLLGDVRDAIQAHPEFEVIEVQGHTDDNGSEEYNLALSQQRAESVRGWLTSHGIANDRLVAKGYGFSRPIADNRIKTGRAANRRVQFVVIKHR